MHVFSRGRLAEAWPSMYSRERSAAQLPGLCRNQYGAASRDSGAVLVRAPAAWRLGVGALICLMLSIAGLPVTAAHPISVTETSVFVAQTRAIVRIQLYAEDLMLFQDLTPDEQDVISPADLERGLQQHGAFLLEKVTLRNAAGETYPGSVTDVKPFKIPPEGIPVSELMLHTATYELEFPFAEPPEYLTMQQDISDPNFIFPSEMQLSVHQTGTDLTYSDGLKAGATVTLRFDWDSVPLGDSASEEDWEKWFEKQREATLGITSYSSIYSFIYIEPAEIRHEVLIPLASLKTVIPVRSRDPSFLEIEEQDAVREEIRGWLKDRNPTTINGNPIAAEVSRVDFYALDLKDFAGRAEPRRISLASGRVGVILTYRPSEDTVREATLTWDRFHAAIGKIQSVVIAHSDQMERFEFSKFNKGPMNVFSWTCPPERLPAPIVAVDAVVAAKPVLQIPVAALVLTLVAGAFGILSHHRRKSILIVALLLLAGVSAAWTPVTMAHPWRKPPEISNEEAVEIFRRLHQGTYRALDFGSENRIYEVLETTVDGPLLEELYLQLRQSLEIREQGGAVARVSSVRHGQTSRAARVPDGPEWPGFQITADWTVTGTVEHWGHIHERSNQFAADFFVEPRGGKWKVTRMDIRNQQQLSGKTTLRSF